MFELAATLYGSNNILDWCYSSLAFLNKFSKQIRTATNSITSRLNALIIFMKQTLGVLIFLAIFSMRGFSQTGTFITVNGTVGREHHEFTVDYGPPSTLGTFKDTNVIVSFIGKYNKQFFKRINTSIGIGYMRHQSNIRRIYNRRYWGDNYAVLNYTTKTSYNILQIPLGVDIVVINGGRAKLLIGTMMNFNFAITQKYGTPGYRHLKTRPYFFGYSNHLSTAIQLKISNSRFIEIRPFAVPLETWKKDAILFENQKEYRHMKNQSSGISIAYGVQL